MNYFKEGFYNLYSTSQVSASWDLNHHTQWQSNILKEEKDGISRMVTEEEISTALWSLKAFKAPGPNGLHAGFF